MGCLPPVCRAEDARGLPGAHGSPEKIASVVPNPRGHFTSTGLLHGASSLTPRPGGGASCLQLPHRCRMDQAAVPPRRQYLGHSRIFPPASFCLQLAVIKPETRGFPRSLSNAFIIIVIILLCVGIL